MHCSCHIQCNYYNCSQLIHYCQLHVVISKLPFLAGLGQHLPQSVAQLHPYVEMLLQSREQFPLPVGGYNYVHVAYMSVCGGGYGQVGMCVNTENGKLQKDSC